MVESVLKANYLISRGRVQANRIPEDVYDEGGSGHCERCCSGRFLNSCGKSNGCLPFLDFWW